MNSQQHSIVLYQTDSSNVYVNVFYTNETLWLTQKAMAELFGVQKAAISKHLKNIFDEGELEENSVVSQMETTAADGKIYNTSFSTSTQSLPLDTFNKYLYIFDL